MAPADKIDMLSLAMGELQTPEIVKLTRVLEKGEGENNLPSAQMLAALRPQLRKIRPARNPNLMRLFCQPFEVVLVNVDAHGVRHGRIERDVIKPVWQLVSETGDEEVKEAAATLEGRIAKGDGKVVLMAARGFWTAAAKRLQTVVDLAKTNSAEEKALRRKIGHPEALDILTEIAGMMKCAGLILSMRDQLEERPITKLDEAQAECIKSHIQKAAKADPGSEYFILLAAQGCLLHPADIFEFLKDMNGDGNEQIARYGEELGNVVFDNLDLAADKLEDLVASGGNEAELTDVVKSFTNELLNVNDVLAITSDASWKKRMTDSMKRVGDIVCSEIFEGSVQTVLNAYGARSGEVVSPDEAEIAAAERRITAVCDCVVMSEPLAIKTQAERTHRELRQQLNGLCQRIVDKARDGNGSDDMTTFRFMTAIKMLELAAGPDHAEEVMIKGLNILQTG